MAFFIRRAIEDILRNRFLNIITIITISLSILIVSAFILFYINTNEFINIWKDGIPAMAYLKPKVEESELSIIKENIQALGVQQVRYISKEEALNTLKAQMKRQSSLFQNLSENPLPDAFEIRIIAPGDDWKKIESFAIQIESLEQIEEVEYGQKWLGRFVHVFRLFRVAGYALGGIFFMATVFIVANTFRLVIYTRNEEIDIMRLVGATDRFIKIPFYIQSIFQGALGAIIGLTALYISFQFLTTSGEHGLFSGFFQIRFVPIKILLSIIGCSMLVGWLGCYLSLKQYLKA
jgi:cell division transport system permease protein